MGYKVLFDGNGSGIIQVVGVGLYVPAEKHNEVMQKWEQAQAERDALAAKVELFKKIRSDWGGMAINDAKTLTAFIQLADKAPHQCLREIEAKAVEKFFVHFESASFWDKTVNDVIDEGYEYAAKVRQGS